MSLFSRVLLRAVSIGAPVFIAACYGPQVRYSRGGTTGRVQDRATRAALPGVEITCDATGAPPRIVTTGAFAFADACATLSARAPAYQAATMPAQGQGPVVFEIDKAP